MDRIDDSGLSEDLQDGMRPRNRDYLARVREFVATPSAEVILEKANFAHRSYEIVPIGGRPGVGKTRTLRYYAATTPRVWYVRFSPDTTSVFAVLSEIAEALGLGNLPSQPAPVRRAIVHRLAAGPSLLICDEAQNLTTKGFEEVRAIFDHLEDGDGFGMVLAGHLDLLDKVASLPQLAGRAAAELRISEAKPADVDALLAGWGFECEHSRQLLRKQAGQKNGLRRIAKVFASAITLAEAFGADLAFEHIERAWRGFDGRSTTN
ncbi:AAA family ATPase [Salinarimonas chemoclinalis]|uniref:AAA family ATPase n=1 Tax=Salinarimonas chemoclinalis TaxID=3241599 RepID=UPI003557BF32